MAEDIEKIVEDLYRAEWGRIVATLIRLVGDFDFAEDSAQEAFAAAVRQWREQGVPAYPRAWIVETARHKAIDKIRRQTKFAEKAETYVAEGYLRTTVEPIVYSGEIPDDRLKLIFTCCHPSLSQEAQIALTLRTLCGLETDEIARAFLTTEATVAQRIVRAKRKIRDAKIPYVVPATKEMTERLESVLAVIYLVFNEGYLATKGDSPLRHELSQEAIRLAKLIRALLMMPAPPREVSGLLALMLLHDARREARSDEKGDIILLEEQDRTKWNRSQIEEALPLVAEAMQDDPGIYALQAAIAAEHCKAKTAAETNWRKIVFFYTHLETLQSSPVVMLNRAVAIGMLEGPELALRLMADLAEGQLENYHLLHAARADMLRRLSRWSEAEKSYSRALALVTNTSERRFLERRLKEISRQPAL